MIDPDLINTCEIFLGDSMKVMKTIKSDSVDFIHAGLYNRDQWTDSKIEHYYKHLKRILRSTGSIMDELFTPYISEDHEHRDQCDIAKSVGLILQQDTMCTHFTKSDNFYRGYSSPDKLIYEQYDNGIPRKRLVNGVMKQFGRATAGTFMDTSASTYTPPGGIVFDPMCGMGSEMIAALQRGRRAIGIDIDEYSVNSCRERIQKYLEYRKTQL